MTGEPTSAAVRSAAPLLLIAGGGTGGHIYPAIAIAQEFVSRDQSRRVVFVGTERGLEKTIVPKAGFPLEFISVAGLKGKGLGDTLRSVVQLPSGFFGAWSLLSKHSPDVILGVGGYSSGPVLAAGAIRGIPTLIHEQNAFPGLTNRILARIVKKVAVAFPEALARFGREGVVTGNPIRQEFFNASPLSEGRERRRLLIFGGSQGSRILNDSMTGALLFLAKMKDRIEIVHQTGPAELSRVAELYRASAFPDARVVAYLDPMSAEIAAADLTVCRAGAMTIGELAAVGRASILVPFALATNNHQELNARAIEAAGGALVLLERELSPERLASTISTILSSPDQTTKMGAASKTLGRPGATRQIVDLIEELGKK